MNWINLQKIFGAVLGTLLFIMAVGFLATSIYETKPGAGGGYTLETAEAEPVAEQVEAPAVEQVSLAALLANADMASGEKLAKKCTGCHSFAQDGTNKVGPALYGVVGRAIAGGEGFGYSDVLSGYNSEGRTWSFENLDAFLTRPKDYAPGTKMSFSGLKSETDRADLLAYMQSLSAAPVAFPTE